MIKNLSNFIAISILILFGVLISLPSNAQTNSIQNPTTGKIESMNISNLIQPPIAKKIPHITHIHDKELVDNYFWLRDKTWPNVENKEILDYLTAENTYIQNFFKKHQKEGEQIYQEIIGRIKLEDQSVPIKKDNYYYYNRTEKDSNHAIYCRKEGEKGLEEIILDANELAKQSTYFNLGDITVSRDHQKLVYSADLTGSDRYTAKVIDLKTKAHLTDSILNTIDTLVWDKQGSGFFYAKLSNNWRTEEIYYHKLGDAQDQDILVYKENDPLFMVGIENSSDERYLFISTESKDATEIRYIDLESFRAEDLDEHEDEQKINSILIEARKENQLYNVDHHQGLFYILTNDKGKNFRLVTTPVQSPGQEHWQEFIAHDPKIYLSEMALYKNHLVLGQKENGLKRIRIIELNSELKSDHNPSEKPKTNTEIANTEIVQFPDPSYQASISFTTFDDKGVRISYSSLVTPQSVLFYDFTKKKLETLKVQEIPSGYNQSLYQSERIFATGADGTQIPISLIYKKSLFKKDGSNPLYLYGYGAYGYAVPSSFRNYIFSLLDRGFVYAIAHVRGGDEMGYEWYENAKFLKKKNSFNDYISVAEHLIKEQYTRPGNITASGASAGGMLIAVCINERPELFKMAVADVPFVDVLNTMLDDTLPLTPGEFKEWGNPKDPQYFDYIKSYSPYDNVKKQKYPAIYVSAGINDPRVTYWEPAKWVAKLRELKTDDNLIFLDTNMDAGHGGASGRFGAAKDIAKEYLFVLTMQGLNN